MGMTGLVDSRLDFGAWNAWSHFTTPALQWPNFQFPQGANRERSVFPKKKLYYPLSGQKEAILQGDNYNYNKFATPGNCKPTTGACHL